MKNGCLPGQSVTLNNTARGKYFKHIAFQYAGTTNKSTSSSGFTYVATSDGLLYFVNTATRCVDKVIQIHDGEIAEMKLARSGAFLASVSCDGVIRLWTPDFGALKSEVKTSTQVASADISYDGNQIAVMSASHGTLSVLDLETSCYDVVMRSHMGHVTDVASNRITGKVVTISGDDFSVKVWNSETMEQLNEFISENDKPCRVVCQNSEPLGEGILNEHKDTLVAVGFESGFLRIIDLDLMSVVHETLLYESPIMDIDFSQDNRFMAVFHKSGQIVIINKERMPTFQPVKNIDYELSFSVEKMSLAFSPDSQLLANISTNANTITVWETRNFSLRYHLDVTGDVIRKI